MELHGFNPDYHIVTWLQAYIVQPLDGIDGYLSAQWFGEHQYITFLSLRGPEAMEKKVHLRIQYHIQGLYVRVYDH